MAIRRVTTDAAPEQALPRGARLQRGLTQGAKRADPRTHETAAPVFGRRDRKKTLVDIEMDADSDLEEFERNQIEKLRGRGSDDDLDADTELARQATQMDKAPGSL